MYDAHGGSTMRIIFAISILCLGLLLADTRGALAQATPPDRAKDAALIRAEIERICQAFVDKDRSTLTATHGKDWRGFTPWSGHVIRGREGYMNEATFEPGTPKGQGMIGFRLSDFDVVFYGDTAVASFVMGLDVVNGREKGTQKLTILDVFHKEANRWIQVASNTSLHPDDLNRMTQPRAEARADSLSGKWGSDGQVFLDLAFDGRSAVAGTAIWRSGRTEQSSPIK